MKKYFLIISLIGLITLTSCGSQENCRGRGDNYKISKSQPTQMLAVIDKNNLK